MTKTNLVKSTSGIRGVVGSGLNPVLAAAYAAAFGTFLGKGKVVVGRDSRPSGDMLTRAVVAGLVAAGRDVVEIGIVPTPTVEIAITALKAAGGICVTASHNPAQWNALKFFNNRGEFITPAQYRKLDAIFNSGKFAYRPAAGLGRISSQAHWIDEHVRRTLAVKAVNKAAIRKRNFKVVVDAVNGAGSVALPLLLQKLGVKTILINCDGDGNFVHEPEPIPRNLGQLGRAVRAHRADLGLACDPDADRLALVDETGRPIGEELTLAIAVRQVLKRAKGPTVINLSTSRTTADTALKMESKLYYSKVGEANVVEMMRARHAIIGGEGNGGVIYPAFHHGRDALVAAALALSALAEEKLTLSELVETFPRYYTIKTKAGLPDDFAARLRQFEREAGLILGKTRIDRRDGLRFDFARGWVQLRASNTEPIFRLIVETGERALTEKLAKQVLRYFNR
jgi:phosphomannomutase